MTRRLFTLLAGALAFGFGSPALAQADWPTKPVKIVVPFAAGGTTDLTARIVAEQLGQTYKQTFIVENKAGAGGNLGATEVAKAAPDGYTFLMGTPGTQSINQFLYPKMAYAPLRSFAPVIEIGDLPNVLVVNPSVPARNVQELVALAKARPGTLSYASSGNGASSHLAGVMFNLRAGTDLQHIPYKGTGPALNDLLGGQVAMTFTDVLTALPHVQAGKLRALAVTTAARSKALPDVPTLAEQGVKDMNVSVFFGIVVPAATPPDVVARLNAAYVRVLADPEVRGKLAAQGLEPPAATTPAHLTEYMRQEAARWQDVVKASGARLD